MDIEMADPPLHPLGAYQIEYNAPKVEAINFKIVLVSPMQRAMLTAIHMFKNHKNLVNIKFLVVPSLREVFHTSNDIHMDPSELMKKYAPGQAICEGLVFDFSMLLSDGSPNFWAV